MKFRRLFDFLPQGTRSLRNVLAFYFIPISIVPVLVISLYATNEFQKNSNRFLTSRAKSEFDAINAELESLRSRLVEKARTHATRSGLIRAVASKNEKSIQRAIRSFQTDFDVRVYGLDGTFLGGRKVSEGKEQVAYVSREAIRSLRQSGVTSTRYFSSDNQGVVYVIRTYVKNSRGGAIGILEEHHLFGEGQLKSLQQRRQVDALILRPDFTIVAGSLAVPKDSLKPITRLAFRPVFTDPEPVFIKLGESRYGAFLYPMGTQKKSTHLKTQNEPWGYLAVFISLATVDDTTGRIRLYMVYLTSGLVLLSMLFILMVARRLVKPFEVMIGGMKRLKTGKLEQIPELDAPDEIDYLVRSFNDMARNIHSTKRALESKVRELHRANEEIRNTQGTLVQSAKMISLGQIVAGVAHELNNPIAFIYSNMHHLMDYTKNIKLMLAEYEKASQKLTPEQREALEKSLKSLDIEYIMKDVEDLTQSCLDGAERTKEIVMGLRTFSRTDKAIVKPSDINEGLRSTVKLLVTQFKERISISEDLDSQLPLVECNLSQLNQVFMNLISNAAQAINLRGEIYVRTRQDKDTVVIEVEDTGAGMDPKVVEHIFDPFFTTKPVGEGTGLGLSIAYNLIDKHAGEISVQSKVGVGTCFTIRLPIKQPRQKTGTPNANSA